MTEIIRKKVLPLILTLALAISLLPAVTPTAGAVDGATATISPASALTEANLDTNSLTVTLSGATFANNSPNKEYFTLNNAPSGVTVESVVYINETSCRVDLAYDGTNFDSDVTNFSLTIASSEFVSVSSGDLTSNDLTITATRTKLATPENLAWDTTIQAKATWDAVDNASGYSVQLYKRDTASGDAVTTTDTSYDFTSALTGTATYYFTVTALGGKTTYSDSNTSGKSEGYSYAQLFTPSNIKWDTTIKAKATWDGNDTRASGYSVQLYKGGTASGYAVTTTDTSYDFTELITETGYT